MHAASPIPQFSPNWEQELNLWGSKECLNLEEGKLLLPAHAYLFIVFASYLSPLWGDPKQLYTPCIAPLCSITVADETRNLLHSVWSPANLGIWHTWHSLLLPSRSPGRPRGMFMTGRIDAGYLISAGSYRDSRPLVFLKSGYA